MLDVAPTNNITCVSNTNTIHNEHCRRQCHPTQRTSSARSSGKMSARSTSSALVRGPIFFTTRAYLQQTMNIVALKYISLLAGSLYLRQIVGHNAGQLWEMPTIPNNSKMITSVPPHTPRTQDVVVVLPFAHTHRINIDFFVQIIQ